MNDASRLPVKIEDEEGARDKLSRNVRAPCFVIDVKPAGYWPGC